MREPREPGHVVKFGKGISALFAKGMWHIPEVMCASVMALIGIGLAIRGCQRYVAENGDNREHKGTYVVVRAGDPRACTLKNPVFT